MIVRLGDYVKIKTGKLDANAADKNGKYPFFTCSVEPLKINTYAYDCECVLVAGNGDLNVKYYNGKFNAYQRTYIIESIDRDILTVPYLYCFLDKYVETLRAQSIGGVIKYIKLGNLNEAQILLPSVEAQNYIVTELNKVNALLEKRKQQLEKLDLLVKARFVEMFGHMQNTFFLTKTIGELCRFVKDGTHHTPEYTTDRENSYKFLSSKDVTSGSIDWTNIKYIPQALHNELYSKIAPQRGDILLAKNGTTGVAALVDTDEIFDIYVSLALLRFKSGINLIYVLYAINSRDVKRQFDDSLKGVGVPNLHLGEIKKTKLIVPPIELQDEFAAFVEQTDKSKLVIKQSLEKLETLKKALMQKYFG